MKERNDTLLRRDQMKGMCALLIRCQSDVQQNILPRMKFDNTFDMHRNNHTLEPVERIHDCANTFLLMLDSCVVFAVLIKFLTFAKRRSLKRPFAVILTIQKNRVVRVIDQVPRLTGHIDFGPTICIVFCWHSGVGERQGRTACG
jgi:hypothetical protein